MTNQQQPQQLAANIVSMSSQAKIPLQHKVVQEKAVVPIFIMSDGSIGATKSQQHQVSFDTHHQQQISSPPSLHNKQGVSPPFILPLLLQDQQRVIPAGFGSDDSDDGACGSEQQTSSRSSAHNQQRVISPLPTQSQQLMVVPLGQQIQQQIVPKLELQQHQQISPNVNVMTSTYHGKSRFECGEQGCNKSFTNKSNLKRHMLIHLVSGLVFKVIIARNPFFVFSFF